MQKLLIKQAGDTLQNGGAFKRWLSRGQKPGWIAKFLNRMWANAASRNAMSNGLVALEVIGVRRPAVNFGNKFHQPIGFAKVTTISGKLINSFFLKRLIRVCKGSGQTNHMERGYNTLRQSCARFVRKTLSFSKPDATHKIVTRLFIVRYNLSMIT